MIRFMDLRLSKIGDSDVCGREGMEKEKKTPTSQDNSLSKRCEKPRMGEFRVQKESKALRSGIAIARA